MHAWEPRAFPTPVRNVNRQCERIVPRFLSDSVQISNISIFYRGFPALKETYRRQVSCTRDKWQKPQVWQLFSGLFYRRGILPMQQRDSDLGFQQDPSSSQISPMNFHGFELSSEV